jgi:hypothetical protein
VTSGVTLSDGQVWRGSSPAPSRVAATHRSLGCAAVGAGVGEDVPVTDERAAAPPPEAEARDIVPVVHRSGPRLPAAVEGPLDVALGAMVTIARPVVAVTAVVGRSFEPWARVGWELVARPPLVPAAWTPAAVAGRLADTGRHVRFAAREDAALASNQALDVIVPSVLDPLLDRVDLTGLVLARVDLERLVGAVLDTMDLTGVVLDRVDLKRIVETAIESIDITEIVRTQVDIASLAEEVIEEVNLPEIIRESSTGVAAEVVDTGRLSAVAGDELVNRWIDRILQRRQSRRTDAPGRAQSEDAMDAADAALRDSEADHRG